MFSFASPHQLTPLHQAAVQGHTDTVRCLIDKGADMNIKEKDGVCELDHTTDCGFVSLVPRPHPLTRKRV